jgi:bifunctional non-homologous end joining protein LigD
VARRGRQSRPHLRTGQREPTAGAAVAWAGAGPVNTMPEKDSITLYSQENGSDKVYKVSLEPEGAGWMVRTLHGRRGSTLVPGTQTDAPVAYEEAKKVYEATVRKKTGKGYRPGAGVTDYAGADLAKRTTAHRPQLLNEIEDPENLLVDPRMLAQEKFDGFRTLIEKQGATVQGINRTGLTTALPQPIAQAVSGLPGNFVVDGELVGDTFHAFDLIQADGMDSQAPYEGRLATLTGLWPSNVVHTARTENEKRALLAEVKARRGEGLVFKDIHAPHQPGRPARGGPQLKLKFWASATCIVVGKNPGKRSVRVGVLDEGVLVEVGSVTIPANHEIPSPNELVEVEYLYAYPGGSLFEPKYRGPRTDIQREECTIEQLKMKAGTGETE